MNFNTFFLDKLSSGDQSPLINSKKTSTATYLFSDIIKVCEQEAAPGLNSENSSANLTLLAQGTFPLPENVIESDNLKLQTISKFIENFIANSQQPVNSSEIKHDLEPVVISKKQFILSSQGLEDFINGLTQSLELITNVDVKKNIGQEAENAEATDPLIIGAASGENQTPALEVKNRKEAKSDDTLQNIEMMVQSFFNFLSTNRSVNLSFKNGAEKVSINIYELPEKNVETKINFEKLSADFEKVGNKSNFTLTDIINESETGKNIFSNSSKAVKENPAEYFLSQSSTNNQAKQVQQSAAVDQAAPVMPVSDKYPNENVYKTEVVEITLRPESESFNLQANASSNTEKLFAGSITLSGLAANDQADMSEAKFRLKGNLSAELNSLETPGKDIIASMQNAKEKIQIFDMPLSNQDFVKSNTSESSDKDIKATIQNVKEKIESTNLSFEKLSSLIQENENAVNKNLKREGTAGNNKAAELNESAGKNIVIELPSAKTATTNNDTLFTHQTVPVVKMINGEKVELIDIEATGKQNKETEINTSAKSRPVQTDNDMQDNANETEIKLSNNSTTDTVAKPSEKQSGVIDAKILLNDLSGKIAATELKKSIIKDDNAKAAKEESVKTLEANENLKDEKASVKDAQSKSSDEKDLTRNKSNENFKSVLQSTDQINGNEADKFKIAHEVKLPHEPVKIIKTAEIVPEFSKIIQAGEKQSVTFQLTPENLGKIKLSIDLIENQISTRIEVENEQVKQLVQSNIEQLKQNLQTSGIQLHNVNISLAESEQKFSKAFSPRKKSGDRISKVKADEEKTRPSQKSLGYNTYEFLA